MSSSEVSINKDNLNFYLNEVAKKYKKLTGGKIPAEIILIGGASVIANYGFRDSTTDIDAIINAASSMKEAIYYVSEKYGIGDGWLNADFKRTSSYSEKLLQYSRFYKTFANVVDVRTVSGEYLIAMKLVSGRRYKHDLSDIIGILKDERLAGNDINLDGVRKAVEDLYGSWNMVSEPIKEFMIGALKNKNYESVFADISANEKNANKEIVDTGRTHSEESKRKSANEIIEMIRASDRERAAGQSDESDRVKNRCVIVGGADIRDFKRIRAYLKEDDHVIYCDSGLRHLEGLGVRPSLIVGDWDSHEDPHMDVETITLPVAKDDTDTVYAAREGMRRGFSEFLLLGVIGARLDHTLVNAYILTTLENNGCHGLIADDYSEMEIVSSHVDEEGVSHAGRAEVDDGYPFFSLVAMEGEARGVTVRNAKFGLEDATIGPDYQYATSNEPLPGKTAEITVGDGRLLLIKIIGQAACH